MSVKEADAFLKNYLAAFPNVSGYMDKTIADAKANGYVSTLFGRRRALPELASTNFNVRASGERMARNTPIQGTAADVIKLAMVRVWKRLRDEKMASRLILTVHDELIVEAPEAEAEKAADPAGGDGGCVQYAVPLSTDARRQKLAGGPLNMIVLGIESTCDETAAALVEDGRHLLSNVISTSVKEQALYGGVVPEIASRRHCVSLSAPRSKGSAGRRQDHGRRGRRGCHLCAGAHRRGAGGREFCQGAGLLGGKPLVPVHHLRGHIAALYLTHPELKPPFLCLVASGRPQPHRGGAGLHPLPHSGPHGGRCCRRSL